MYIHPLIFLRQRYRGNDRRRKIATGIDRTRIYKRVARKRIRDLKGLSIAFELGYGHISTTQEIDFLLGCGARKKGVHKRGYTIEPWDNLEENAARREEMKQR